MLSWRPTGIFAALLVLVWVETPDLVANDVAITVAIITSTPKNADAVSKVAREIFVACSRQ